MSIVSSPLHRRCARAGFDANLTDERDQKYYLVVMLVEVTSVDQLIERLRKGKYKPAVDILADSKSCV